MKQALASMLVAILSRVNAFPTRKTEHARLEALMRRLHPVRTDRPLVRLGPAHDDGGYLVVDDLDGIGACFSPGVCEESGFEKDCADRGIPVFMADLTVDAPSVPHELFRFERKHVGVVADPDHLTLQGWVQSSGIEPDADLLLQMDIEGMEYEVLLAAPEALLRRTRILVVEFHRLEQLWNEPFFNLAQALFERILSTHACVHIHPNNCYDPFEKEGLAIPPIMEFTFHRKDRLTFQGPQTLFPHPLDHDNTDRRLSVPLPKCWFGGPSAEG